MTRTEPDDSSDGAPIFHSKEAATALWGRPIRELRAFRDFLARKLRTLAEPEAKAFHLAHLMPIPSYEYAYGLRIPAGAAYDPPFALDPDCALTLRAEPGTSAGVMIAGLQLDIERVGGAWRVLHAGRTIDDSSGDLLISCRLHGGSRHFAVNGRSIAVFEIDAASAAGTGAAIEVRAGTAYLLAAQTLAGGGGQLWFCANPAGLDDLVEFREERNPYRFDWGLRTYGILNCFIAVAVARDMLLACPSDLDGEALELRDGIATLVADPALPSFLLNAYLRWPHWRPGVGRYPETGPWDRNSFTNGTIPALVALLARITGRDDESEVRAAFDERGAAFLNTIVRADFLKLRARDRDFWLKRSANHGLVMLTSFMLGARLLGMQHRPDIAAVETQLGHLLHDLHADGSFCEGIAYDFFALGFLLPYRALARGHMFTPERGMKTLDATLGATFDWITLSHDAGGEVFANFGDNFTDRVRRTSHLAYVQVLADSRLDLPIGYADRIDEQFSFAPPLDDAPAATTGLEARFFPANRIFLAAEYAAGGRRQGLFVIGSRLQLTHNRNHDCGGFAFYRGDAAILIPSSQRQSWKNNAMGLERDGAVVPHAGDRAYSGRMKNLNQSPDRCSVATFAKLDTSFSSSRDAQWLARTFTLRRDHPLPLVVVTRVKVSAGIRPFLGFQLRAMGLSPDGDRPWLACFGRREGGEWQSLAGNREEKVHRFRAPATAEDTVVFEFLTCVVTGQQPLDPGAISKEAPSPRKLDETDQGMHRA